MKTTKKAGTKKAAKAKATKGKAQVKTEKRTGVGAFVYGLIEAGRDNKAIQEAVAKAFPDSALNQNPSAHIGWYRSRFNKDRSKTARKPARKAA